MHIAEEALLYNNKIGKETLENFKSYENSIFSSTEWNEFFKTKPLTAKYIIDTIEKTKN